MAVYVTIKKTQKVWNAQNEFAHMNGNCLREKGRKRKRLKEWIQILICVAKTKAELCYLLDFNLALSEEPV